MSQREGLRPSKIALASAALFGLVGVPVGSPAWPALQVDIERASWAVEGKRSDLPEPGLPRGFVCWLKMLLKPILRMQLIQALLLGPDERVKRCSGHWAFPVSPVFPITPQFLPTREEYSKDEATRQGVRHDPICSRGGLSQSTRGGTRRSAHMFASWPSGKRAFVQPWRSEQQWEDTLAFRGKLVQEGKTGEITPISEVFLQNHASPSRLLTTRKSKKARI